MGEGETRQVIRVYSLKLSILLPYYSLYGGCLWIFPSFFESPPPTPAPICIINERTSRNSVLNLTHFLCHLGLLSEEQFAAVELAVVHADEERVLLVGVSGDQGPLQQAAKHVQYLRMWKTTSSERYINSQETFL